MFFFRPFYSKSINKLKNNNNTIICLELDVSMLLQEWTEKYIPHRPVPLATTRHYSVA